MCPRGLIVVLLVHVALDLAIPLTPGPAGFDIEDAVEALQVDRGHQDESASRAAAARAPLATRAGTPVPARRPRGIVGRRPRPWLTRIGRTPPPASRAASAADDH